MTYHAQGIGYMHHGGMTVCQIMKIKHTLVLVTKCIQHPYICGQV